MSRNVDKANSVLVRYQELQAEKSGGYKDYSRYKRPTKVTSVQSLNEAQEWRKQVIRDIKDKSTRIYDPSLNESQLTELNDELNDLFKERTRWDWHISQLPGGKNATKRGRDDVAGGKVINGKRYFGRAFELPEVQALLKQQQAVSDSKKMGKGVVNIKLIPKDKASSYYGKNAESSELERFELTWTNTLRKESAESCGRSTQRRDYLLKPNTTIPTTKEMELWLVARRKKKLLDELNL